MTKHNNPPRPTGHLVPLGAGSIIVAVVLLAGYVGITERLCQDIQAGLVSPAAQVEMKLSPEICNKPWWEKL